MGKEKNKEILSSFKNSPYGSVLKRNILSYAEGSYGKSFFNSSFRGMKERSFAVRLLRRRYALTLNALDEIYEGTLSAGVNLMQLCVERRVKFEMYLTKHVSEIIPKYPKGTWPSTILRTRGQIYVDAVKLFQSVSERTILFL